MNLIEMSQDIKFAKAKGGTIDKIKPEMFSDPHMVMETKYDGCRYRMVIEDGKVILQSRRISKKTGKFVEKQDRVPHLFQYDLSPWNGTIIEGEIIAGDGCDCTSSDVVSIMGCDANKAIMRQEETGKLHWVMFDILFYKGEDVRGCFEAQRRSYLHQFHGDRNMSTFRCESGRVNYFSMSTRCISGDLRLEYDKLIAEGYEGGMMKDTQAVYGKGWYKVKKVVDLDVVCTGFTEGKGKYAGKIGAVTFGVFYGSGIMEISQAGGMEDVQRDFMTLRKISLVGEPMAILAQEITKTKTGYSVRHPRFKCWRPDIGVADCTLEKFLKQGDLND